MVNIPMYSEKHVNKERFGTKFRIDDASYHDATAAKSDWFHNTSKRPTVNGYSFILPMPRFDVERAICQYIFGQYKTFIGPAKHILAFVEST